MALDTFALGKPEYALQLSAGHPQGHLYLERYRIAELREPGIH